MPRPTVRKPRPVITRKIARNILRSQVGSNDINQAWKKYQSRLVKPEGIIGKLKAYLEKKKNIRKMKKLSRKLNQKSA
jgi:hypothetical protein